MSWVVHLSGICLIAGGLVGLIGAVGVLRFPDIFSRLHPAGITDTLCASLILFGLMLQAAEFAVVAKLLLILFFLLFTTPSATLALAKTAAQGDSAIPDNKGAHD
jgi:multicomponent Na+:H+ antiporter subunit G